jgi:hypothetical protein
MWHRYGTDEQVPAAVRLQMPFEQIAKAMIVTSLSASAKSDAYHYAEMMALNRVIASTSARRDDRPIAAANRTVAELSPA